MATIIYPAVIERAGNGFSVFFPDLPGCTSAGGDETEAAINAEEALYGHLLLAVQSGEELPSPSPLQAIPRDPDVDEVARVLVRAERPGKSVRINVTLDESLIAAIDRITGNRSGFLADAARAALAARRAA